MALVNDGICAHDLAVKPFEYRNDSIPLDRGRFVVVQQCSRLTAICLATCVGLNTVYTMYFHLFGWSII